MRLWRLINKENTGYDTFDSVIVAAKDKEEAVKIHPYYSDLHGTGGQHNTWDMNEGSWCSHPSKVKVEYVGTAAIGTKRGVILASFNSAG